jgi:hypothetical protein
LASSARTQVRKRWAQADSSVVSSPVSQCTTSELLTGSQALVAMLPFTLTRRKKEDLRPFMTGSAPKRGRRATSGTRTLDFSFTKAALYQLS